MKKKGLVISIIAILIVIIISVIFYFDFSKNYSISIKSPKDVVKEIKSKFSSGDTKGKSSPNSSSGNSGTSTNSDNTGNNNKTNSNIAGNKNTGNKEGEQVTKNVSITLKMSDAVIGTKVQIVIGDDVKAKYSDIAFYEVFDGENQISPQAKIDAPTLIMANKQENDMVKVKLLDSNAKVLAKLSAKLVK